VLCLDTDASVNLIARPLVDLLGLQVYPRDKEYGDDGITAPASTIINGVQTLLECYVDISWSLHTASSSVYRNTRFYVVEGENSSFDAVLSRESAKEYGLMEGIDVSSL
jgi:hypothetical protein